MACLALLLGGLQGCGGGGSSQPAAQPSGPAGIFAGTIVSRTAGPGAAFALLLPDGTFRAVQTSLLQASGTLDLDAGTGSATLFGHAGLTYAGHAATRVAIGAAAGANNTFHGTYAGIGDSGSLQLAPDAAADAPVALSQVAGAYSAPGANVTTGEPTDLTVTATGAIVGSDNTQELQGQLTQLPAAANGFNNAFAVSLERTAPGAAQGSGQTYAGLAFWHPGPGGSTNSALILMLDNGDQTPAGAAQFAGVFRASAAPPPEPGAPTPATGSGGLAKVWIGTVHDDQADADYSASGLILEDGSFRSRDSRSAQVSGQLGLAADGTLTGAASLYLPGPAFNAFALDVQGTASEQAVAATYGGHAGPSGSLAVAPDATANVLLDPATMAGAYAAPATRTSTGLQASLQLSPDQASDNLLVSGSDSSGATVQGVMQQELAWANAFLVSLAYTPASVSGQPAPAAVTFTGLAFFQFDPTQRVTLLLDDGTAERPPTAQFTGVFDLAPASNLVTATGLGTSPPG